MFGLTPFRRGSALVPSKDFFDFNNFFDSFPELDLRGSSMKADIKETDEEYTIEAELPGIEKENIQLNYKGGVLNIFVEQKDEKKEEKETYIRKERKYGSYSRSFYMEDIDPENVDAKFNNGVLTIKLKKSEQTKKVSNIEIKEQ